MSAAKHDTGQKSIHERSITCIQSFTAISKDHSSPSYNNPLTHETEDKGQLLDVRPPHGVEATRHMTSELSPLTAEISRKPNQGFQHLLSSKARNITSLSRKHISLDRVHLLIIHLTRLKK